jgi:hypothetical protein
MTPEWGEGGMGQAEDAGYLRAKEMPVPTMTILEPMF